MLLPPGGQLDCPVPQRIGGDQLPFLGDRYIVDPGAAAPDQAPCLGVAGGKARDARTAGTPGCRPQVPRPAPLRWAMSRPPRPPRTRAARFRRRVAACVGTVREGSRLGRQNLLRLVDLGAAERFQAGDFRQRQIGEQAQEAADVAILGVAPELPVIVGGQAIRRSARSRPGRSCPSCRRRRW